MALRTLSNLFVSLSLLACTSVFAAPLVVNIDGVESYGMQGDSGNTILAFNVGAGATITSIAYDVNVTAFDPSYLSELALFFRNSDGTGAFFGVSGTGASGTETDTGGYDLEALNASFSVGDSGMLYLEFYEFYDDFEGADGIWNFGTITFGVTDADVPGDVPEPASALLIGAGLAAMGYAGRRRRKGAKTNG